MGPHSAPRTHGQRWSCDLLCYGDRAGCCTAPAPGGVSKRPSVLSACLGLCLELGTAGASCEPPAHSWDVQGSQAW
ncbi:hypothetical protein P7K49_010019 [Saguinus oedipus]|uniref:Uncharacterized protein n=1 Tax=Saguinus oedipus TaxID=9490 RepID=A0ABQ9VNX4_SAGOE|nr:hypothetical protein P7K49_010019 [Saguinus oedipus]